MQFLHRLTALLPDLIHCPGASYCINNSPRQPVTAEYIGTGPFGKPALSICQPCGQGEDPERVKQMCFEMELTDGKLQMLRPYLYRDDSANLVKTPISEYRTGFKILTDEHELAAEIELAAAWSHTLIKQGFLKEHRLNRWPSGHLAF